MPENQKITRPPKDPENLKAINRKLADFSKNISFFSPCAVKVCIIYKKKVLGFDLNLIRQQDQEIKSQLLKRLGYCAIYRHDNTQEARQVGILGAERRAPPLVRRSAAISSLLARTAQHAELPNAKIDRT